MKLEFSEARRLLLTLIWLTAACGYAGAQESQERWNTIRLGNQEWMLDNLDVDRFRNGDPIPRAKTAREWERAGKREQPVWCYYESDPGNGGKYGRLYNWYAVTDPRGLAPEGWHIPSRREWEELADHLGGLRAAGTKMKSDSGWACGKNGSNESGFNGLPAGIRSHGGSFGYPGQYTYWWAADEFNELYAYYRYLYWSSGKLFNYVNYYKGSGFSVRCLKDQSPDHSPCAVCSPTRYGVLTGTDPFRRYHTSHVLFNGEPLVVREGEETVASLLKKAGYQTAVIGKWHPGLGDNLPRNLNDPGRGANRLGFDHL